MIKECRGRAASLLCTGTVTGLLMLLQKCIKRLTVKWWIGVERWEIGMGSGSVPIETSSCMGSIVVIADIFE